jgi:hypothetical protein
VHGGDAGNTDNGGGGGGGVGRIAILSHAGTPPTTRSSPPALVATY